MLAGPELESLQAIAACSAPNHLVLLTNQLVIVLKANSPLESPSQGRTLRIFSLVSSPCAGARPGAVNSLIKPQAESQDQNSFFQSEKHTNVSRGV